MDKKVRSVLSIITGIVLCLFIVLSDNFSFVIGPSVTSGFLMLIYILLPKLAFGALLGLAFWAILPLSDRKDGIFASVIPVCTILIYQIAEIIIKWESIVGLLNMPGTKGTYYSLSVWVFIAILFILDLLYFDSEKWHRLAGDLLIVCIITIAFCALDFILPVFINAKFLTAFQIGGFFIARGIYNGSKN